MTVQKKILIPTINAESWRDLLADRELHWKEGYSAMLTALSWEKNNDLPKEIKQVLSDNIEFNGIELLLAIPEYKVSLPGGSRPSQNDVLALITSNQTLSLMTVEGKTKEDFDDKICDWKNKTSETGIKKRLGFILDKIGVKDDNIEHLRYQLFHRLASAVIMTEKFHAKNAIMIIQSFNDNNDENHFQDFLNFLKLYKIESAEKNKLYKLKEINGINLFAGWVYSKIE
jgi:hypothetical protein